MDTSDPFKERYSRREFLGVAGSIGSALVGAHLFGLGAFRALAQDENPLAVYPERGWEAVYRDQYRVDRSFTFICDPNDTHACRLRAFVRNGVVVRIEQAYDVATYDDQYGNKASSAWNPRGCLKGYTIHQRVYGRMRIQHPMVRAGWKAWVDAGMPNQEAPGVRERYFKRGEDTWEQVSWDEATTLVATALLHIITAYGGEEGAARLRAQGYPDAMIEAMHGSGAQVVKMRAGMPLLGVTRIMSLYRFANVLALIDGKLGARGWSNFDWHGDLPPGHPMVTGVQCFDVDLNDARSSKLFIVWGKNLVENKMADSHWFIEVMERGGKIVVVVPEYSPAVQKADYWVPVRPGSDTALILGLAHLLIEERKFDEAFVKKHTDLPLLVRLDTLKLLRAEDVLPGYELAPLIGYSATVQRIPDDLRKQWGDFLCWDLVRGGPAPVHRELVGGAMLAAGLNPALEGAYEVTTRSGERVPVKPVFQLYRELCAEYTPEVVSEMTGTPADLVRRFAGDLGSIQPCSIHSGEGVNHYFHCDMTYRGLFLLAALTGNVGRPGGNHAHWAGNYKSAVFPGLPHYVAEDPFAIDQGKVHKYWKSENPAYWNYGDRPSRFTGHSHMPVPTKVEWHANVNHLNNSKWAYNMITNVQPREEMIVYQDWEWTGSCEYADVVFPVHSWLELTQPDMTASCSNPFLQAWKGGIAPLYDTRQDSEVVALVAEKLSVLTGDRRFREYFKYILDGRAEVYLQRILDNGSTTRGYRIEDLVASERGRLLQFRTYPRIPGWEQIHEDKPFYNKTGRLEFYRDEDEFIRYGENLIVHREPVEATPYLPNVIVSSHPAIRPTNSVPLDASAAEDCEGRNIAMPWSQVKGTRNPLWAAGYRFYFLTPKTRHRVHSSFASEWHVLWDSNFADVRRADVRTPYVGEGQVHINPADASELGIEDGDYVWVDANPADRPYVGWQPSDPFYKIARLLVRARYNPAYPRGVLMMKHGSAMATPKTVRAHESRKDKLAKAADTGYQAHVRYGSHQSLTRGWLQPTQMTDSLVRKEYYGQGIGVGYESDIHSPNTCPKETLVRITRAEAGGIAGKGPWDPVKTGLTPGHESAAMQRYLQGGYVEGV